VSPATYVFEISKEPGTDVNTDISNLNYTVTSSYAPIVGVIQLPQTGQTPTDPIIAPLSSGADGSLQEGVAWDVPRFSSGATSGGSVICTTSGGVVNDSLTGLVWTQDASLFGNANWDDALANADSLNLCGYDDWRLPNSNELSSLINYAASSQATWLTNSGGFANVQETFYLTSSTVASSDIQMWIVHFSFGNTATSYKNNHTAVWYTRGTSGE